MQLEYPNFRVGYTRVGDKFLPLVENTFNAASLYEEKVPFGIDYIIDDVAIGTTDDYILFSDVLKEKRMRTQIFGYLFGTDDDIVELIKFKAMADKKIRYGEIEEPYIKFSKES